MLDYTPLQTADTIIFDMDGTLVDTSRSYTEVIKETIKRYLALFIRGDVSGDDLLSSEEVRAFKQLGGFNNDWDVVAAVLYYYVSLIDGDIALNCPDTKGNHPVETTHELFLQLKHLQRKSLKFSDLLAKKNIPGFIHSLTVQSGEGLNAVRQALSDKNSHLVFYQGDLSTTNLVQRIYQELYQGTQLFQKYYWLSPLFDPGDGYYRNETLLVDPVRLQQLARQKTVAIATGRIQAEAQLALSQHGLQNVFKTVVADDDVSSDQRKPQPGMLYQIADRLSGQSYVYVGDIPDDIKAANAAKEKLPILSVSVYDQKPQADYFFETTNSFLEAIL